MFKKIAAFLLLTVLMSFSLTADAALKRKEAIAIAQPEVPQGAINYQLGVEAGTNMIIARFRNNDTYINYDIRMNSETGALISKDIIGSNYVGSTTVLKTAEDARQIALAAYPDAQDLTIDTIKEDVNTYYKATFNTPKFKEAVLEISPSTGAIGKHLLKYREVPPTDKKAQ